MAATRVNSNNIQFVEFVNIVLP